MLPSGGILEKARRARDARFDGRFFIAVRTTGIYCRPVCPVRLPRAENVTFFESAAAASEAGYWPCLRCRPESSPGTPAWRGTSTTVTRALRLINDGLLDDGSVQGLSERLGVTTRHLTRLFAQHLGASPKAIAQTRRLHFAKKLIDETALSMTEIALSSGYGSVRRFNDHFRVVYGSSPSELRRQRASTRADGITLQLSFRPPFDFHALRDFFGMRATPGVEGIVQDMFWRSFCLDGARGQLQITPGDRYLSCTVIGGDPRSLMKVMQKVRRMFDLDAVPQDINDVLANDIIMARLVRHNPGQRLPGAFDEFETSIRAIVGQQVSVKGASTVMGRITTRYGSESGNGWLFPDAATLASLDPAGLPMPGGRALAIREFARQVTSGELSFDMDEQHFIDGVMSIKGIGPWTAAYMAMRVLGNPDAFLHGDLVIRKVMQRIYGVDSEKDVLAISENWRPWRGYAGMHLWRQA